jgi:hypothetical protein
MSTVRRRKACGIPRVTSRWHRPLLLLRASAPLREIKKRRHRPASFLRPEKKKRITELACLGGVILLRQVFSSVADANEIDFVFYQNLDRDSD